MADIVITWLEDYHECESCGRSYAEGALVTVDDVKVLDLRPYAHCFSGQSWERYEVYNALLEELGHKVVER
jgi:hypothetical protein